MDFKVKIMFLFFIAAQVVSGQSNCSQSYQQCFSNNLTDEQKLFRKLILRNREAFLANKISGEFTTFYLFFSAEAT
jgi:hypothetical protein